MGNLLDDSDFSWRRRIQSKVEAPPPPIEHTDHSAQVEVIVGLGERDPKLCLKLGQLIGRRIGQRGADGRAATLNENVFRHAINTNDCVDTNVQAREL